MLLQAIQTCNNRLETNRKHTQKILTGKNRETETENMRISARARAPVNTEMTNYVQYVSALPQSVCAAAANYFVHGKWSDHGTALAWRGGLWGMGSGRDRKKDGKDGRRCTRKSGSPGERGERNEMATLSNVSKVDYTHNYMSFLCWFNFHNLRLNICRFISPPMSVKLQ